MADLAPWLIGPAGIWFGWWLNQRSTRNLTLRAEERAEEIGLRQRVLDSARLARQVASGARDLLHAMYLKGTGKPPVQLTEIMDEYNSRRDRFKDSVLALRLLGPSWAVKDAQRIDLLASRLTELAFRMQQQLTSEQVKSANTEIPQLDELVNSFVAEVASRYNAAAAELPPQPDYEAEGRWEPLGAGSTS